MALTQKQIKQLWARDPYCVHCGADTGLQVHHRRNRQMGGSKILDRMDNLLRVCAWLNYAMESDAEVATEARSQGWKLGQWDGFDTPVFDKVQQKWWLFDEKGNKFETTPPMFLL